MNSRSYTTDMLNDPFFIGFDSLLNKLNRPVQGSTNYPPYNLMKTGDDTFLIELAVAGFSEEEIDIEVQDGTLTIKGEDTRYDSDKVSYIHKGIATRNFERKFTLADTIQVDGASMHNGVLSVKLVNVIPEEKKPRKIPIGSPELLLEE